VFLAQARVGRNGFGVLLGPAADAAERITRFVASTRGQNTAALAYRRERAAQADLLREVFGNPMRTRAVDPTWLEWNQGFLSGFAQGIYDDRTFHRMPILADALEDAGCAAAEILAHLRGPGPHVRGCFVLDLLLGKK
jgi:hypothetical protein